MASVKIRNVEKSYGTLKVIHGVNIDVKDHEFVVLVGPSGCGKSTLLRMIAGLETISGGEIVIGDKVVNDVPPRDRDIAMVFQNYALYPHMSIFDNMGFSLKLRKRPKSEIEEKVLEAAEILNLKPYLERSPGQLSGGQRQRVAIARALAPEPSILLLDEPTSALDVSVQAEILNLLSDLRAEHDLTFLMVSHDLAVVAHMCERIAVMQAGEIVEVMSVDEMRAMQPSHPYTAQLLEASLGYSRQGSEA